MTRQDFERLRLSIEAEPFVPRTTGPFAVGLERGAFETQKLKRLIAAARTCDAATVRHRLDVHQRQLKRAGAAQKRFEKLSAELQSRQKPFPKVHLTNVHS